MLITPFIRISIWVFIVQIGFHSPKHFHWKEQIQAGQATTAPHSTMETQQKHALITKTGQLTSIKPLKLLSMTNRMWEMLELTELLCSRITHPRDLHWARKANSVIQGLCFTGLNPRTKMIKGIYRQVKPNCEAETKNGRSWWVQQKVSSVPYQQRPHSDLRTLKHLKHLWNIQHVRALHI